MFPGSLPPKAVQNKSKSIDRSVRHQEEEKNKELHNLTHISSRPNMKQSKIIGKVSAKKRRRRRKKEKNIQLPHSLASRTFITKFPLLRLEPTTTRLYIIRVLCAQHTINNAEICVKYLSEPNVNHFFWALARTGGRCSSERRWKNKPNL